ncbi:MAG: PadR family transcriptional regulator [Actinomycetota bacterium]|nr:PadR family transcriptional regulator [Actinomycetota bacterium]
MAIREGLLALLSEQPKYGYQLKAEFEARTGAVWPLNVGQVYTTLDRLERDGFVVGAQEADPEPQRRRRYQLTASGRHAQESWFAASTASEVPPRDGLVMKVLLAVHITGIDAMAVIRVQRTARVERLQVQRRRQRDAAAAGSDGLGERLVADALAIHLESEVRWLDLCEERLVQDGRAASHTDAARNRK